MGSSRYSAAHEVLKTVIVGKLPQTVVFTSTAPTSPAVGGTYRPAAKATSGLKVTYSIDPSSSSVCSIHDGVVTFLRPGRCTIVARQMGSSRYSAAHEVLKTVIVGKLPQTVAFTSTAPTSPAVGGTYRPAAKATSGLKVTYSIDPSSSSVCSIHDGVVTFLRPGRCTIVARQMGSSRYSAAHEVLKTVIVGKPVLKARISISLVLVYPNNVASLSASAKAQLEALAKAITRDGLKDVTITGYCSSPGSTGWNWTLSVQRATVAEAFLKAFLVTLGSPRVRMSIRARGASSFAHMPTWAASNRRVVITAA